ncbi:hypothetical protein DGG96_13605 [Legionella qingyii]|uniref:F-box domain-containing protein n=1 Tax=Legionella qingyii TaxID=2184757 RepID=A0A317U366_9GAMM|nr:hypothetical protein [Legionella qingyii]PWY55206.1 hypothetical protein DGG96_13605 [Legionella qingyii]RUR25371.1 hypothetical protein ELY20_02625 [Legionella qingyii]RUR28518.1 hypothetical protein ELY16_03385 [Legionella qingyii]
MRDKFELFYKMPPEIQNKIVQDFSNHDLGSLTMVSKTHGTLFKPQLDIRQFLHAKMRFSCSTGVI